jgi:hypothetical protein
MLLASLLASNCKQASEKTTVRISLLLFESSGTMANESFVAFCHILCVIGTVKGVTYFSCSPTRGLMVPLNELSLEI